MTSKKIFLKMFLIYLGVTQTCFGCFDMFLGCRTSLEIIENIQMIFYELLVKMHNHTLFCQKIVDLTDGDF